MDFRKARETDDLPPAASEDSGLIPIDFAHLVDALERAQRQSVAAVAEKAAASGKHGGISDNALKGLEAIVGMPQPQCPGTFHNRVAEVVRAANARKDNEEGTPNITDRSSE